MNAKFKMASSAFNIKKNGKLIWQVVCY